MEKWLIWCDLNAEQDALEKAFGDLAVSIRGTTPPDKRIEYENAWRNGDVPIMITKPLVFGFGMNWQHCHNMAFVGLSDSYEQQYQAVRRCWRFGQENDVNVYMITSEAEGAVVENVKRKEKQHQEMFDNVVKHMSVNSAVRKQTTRNEMEYKVEKATGKNWELYLGDCIEMMDEVESDSVGFSIYSPPFPGMYVYSNSVRDVGNSMDVDAMIEHFRWLVKKDKLYRVTMPGRLTAIHLMQLQAFINRDGYMGLKDYRGKVIQMMIDEGWIFKGEVCIDKNPQLQATRNKEHQLLFKTLASDSSKMRMALADYLIYFQKPGDNPEPIKAGISYKYNPGLTEEDITELRYEYTDECISRIIERDYPGVNSSNSEKLRQTILKDEDYYHEIDNFVSVKMKDHMVYDGGWITEEEWIKWAMPIWPAYDLAPGTSYYDYLPPVWYRQTKGNPYGIKETDVLNVRQAKETDDERHLCPLQLGVIERAIKLWSAPGDIILSPFAGIGSEGYQALKLDRKFIGMELKRAYFTNAIRTLERAEKEKQVVAEDIFSLIGQELTFTDFEAKRTMAAEFNGRKG